MSLPLSLYQAMMERKKETQVRVAEVRKVEPTHRVSPIPGTVEVAAHREA